MLFNVTVTVQNINLYPLSVDWINLNIYLNPNATMLTGAQTIVGALTGVDQYNATYASFDPLMVGNGTKGALTFPPQHELNFTMLVDISYHAPSTGLLSDAAIAELLQGCGILKYANGTNSSRPIQISSDAVAHVSGIGLTMELKSSVHIKCPVPNLQSLIQGAFGN